MQMSDFESSYELYNHIPKLVLIINIIFFFFFLQHCDKVIEWWPFMPPLQSEVHFSTGAVVPEYLF